MGITTLRRVIAHTPPSEIHTEDSRKDNLRLLSSFALPFALFRLKIFKTNEELSHSSRALYREIPPAPTEIVSRAAAYAGFQTPS
jgi:hypothetical protein